jgi:RNA polymerase sigma-70 factor, ECF subfamily
MTVCTRCSAAPGVVETPVGEGSEKMCWTCAHAEIGDESVPVEPADRERETRRQVTVAAFEASVRPALGYLRGVALRLTRNEADADDVLQEALMRALKAWPMFEQRTERETGAWLSVIVKRCFVDEWRKLGRRAERPNVDQERIAESFHAEEDAGAWSDYIDAQRAIARLSPDHRDVLELAMIGTPYEEIASRLGVPVGTVMSRLYRARRTVEASL